MGTIQESLPDKDLRAEPALNVPAMGVPALGVPPLNAAAISAPTPLRTRQSLPPKGSCWYCEKPLDSVRRFCGKECADGFDEEAEFTRS